MKLNHMDMNRTVRGLVALLIVCLLFAACNAQQDGDDDEANVQKDKPMQWDAPPEMAIDPSKAYTALLKTTKGEFTIELFADTAPITVNNFIFLAKQGYYDGVTFHRIIETFMIQTGDPLGDGTGGPGYTIKDELDTPHMYEPGIVAMAKAMAPDTGGSQFFICTGEDSYGLNYTPDYTIFGKVVSGMDTVLEIARTPVTMGYGNDASPSLPIERVTIDEVEIFEK